MEIQDDASVEILMRVAARDAAALAELYDRHSRLLFGLIVRIVRDQQDAEEVLQEVFVQAWTRADSYNAALGSPAGWLVGIARNRAIDRLRANVSRLRAFEAAPLPPPVDTPESLSGATERQRDVRRALDALPREQRELIERAYFLGSTHSELAAQLALPLGTVKTRMRSGLAMLRALLDRRLLQQ